MKSPKVFTRSRISTARTAVHRLRHAASCLSALRTCAMKTSSSDGTIRWNTTGPRFPLQLSSRRGFAGRNEQVQRGAGRLHAQIPLRTQQLFARAARIGSFHLVAMLGDLHAGVRRIALDQPSFVHQAHPVAALRFIQISGGDQNGDAVFHKLIQDGPEIAARNRIDAVGGLVQEQDFADGAAGYTSGPASASCRRKACRPGACGKAPCGSCAAVPAEGAARSASGMPNRSA